nr:hypothetical protein [Tanacetum cinerariifolium]
YQSGEGYHVVPPSYTRTFMPPKPDLFFHDAPTVSETVPTVFNVKLSTTKPTKVRKDADHVPTSLVYDSSAKTKKQDDKTKREAKGKSPVELSIGIRNLSEEFEDFSDNSINEVNAASTPVPAAGQISTNSTNTFSVDGPSNTAVSLTLGKSSYMDPSQ